MNASKRTLILALACVAAGVFVGLFLGIGLGALREFRRYVAARIAATRR